MPLDCRSLRPELPRLASPLPVKLAPQATPALQPHSIRRLSPVEAKTLPLLVLPSSSSLKPPTRAHCLPSITLSPSSLTAAPSPSPAPAAANERTIRDLAARLALLLHARECCKGGRPRLDPSDKDAVGESGCLIRNCGVARGVLDHCQECFLHDGECHVSCAQAKRLLRHFRLCRARGNTAACRLCSVLSAEFPWALRHAASLSPLYLQRSTKANTQVAVARLCRIVSNESDCVTHDADGSRPTKRRR